MRAGRYEFKPSRFITLLTMVLFAALVSLGFWQLDRAAQKRQLLAHYSEGSRGAVLTLQAGRKDFAGLEFQRVRASGYYDSAHQLLLDNRTYHGVAGYHVLTPLRLSEQGAAVLVNRGWVPVGSSRRELPDIAVGQALREVRGQLRFPARNFVLGEGEPFQGWPYRIQRLEPARVAKLLGYPLLPVVVQLDREQPDGYVRDWAPLHFGPERNVGYAVQWFGLAAALMVIYLVVNLRPIDRREAGLE